MVIKKKIIKLASGNLFTTGLNALYGIYIARILGPEYRGLLALMMTAAIIISSLFSLGIPNAAAYFVRNRHQSAIVILNTTAMFSVILIPITTVLVLGTRDTFSGIIWAGHKLSDVEAAWIIVYSALTFAVNTLGVCIVAKGDATRFLVATITGVLLTIIVSVFSMAAFHKPFESILGGYIFGQIVSLYLMRRSFSGYLGHSGNSVTYRQLISFGLKSYVGSISSFVFKKVDIYIVGALLSASAVGHYAVAMALRDLGLTAARAVAGIVGGELAVPGSFTERKQRLLRNALFYVTGASVVLAIVAIGTFQTLIPIVFGHAYQAAIEPATILMVSAIFLSGAIVYTAANFAANSPFFQSMGSLTVGVIGLFLLWYGASLDGLTGIALANILVCILAMAMQFSIFYFIKNHNRLLKNNDCNSNQ